jgi:hypothetical protein
MGLYDGSFGYNTIDGPANGGKEVSWYFWPQLKSKDQTDFWKTSVMGGETRPELQEIIFRDDYPAGTENHQDFMLCVETTHASYILHHGAFQNGGFAGKTLRNTLHAHNRLGYNYHVSHVGVSDLGSDKVDIDVTVEQGGVAPFYYELDLQLKCPGMTPMRRPGVNSILDRGDSKVFSFENVPARAECLNDLSLTLESPMAFEGRPVKFAQGDGTVSLYVPKPSGSTPGGSTPDSPPSNPPDDADEGDSGSACRFLCRVLGNLFPNFFST